MPAKKATKLTVRPIAHPFYVLSDFDALICRDCGCALPGRAKSIQQHVQKLHGGARSPSGLEALLEGFYVQPPKELPVPDPSWQRSADLQRLLASPVLGYRCDGCPADAFLSMDRKTVNKHHWKAGHSGQPQTTHGRIYSWGNNLKRWFLPDVPTTVEPPTGAVIDQAMLAYFEHREKSKVSIADAYGSSPDRYDAWHRHTGWPKYFDKKSYPLLYQQTVLPNANMPDPLLLAAAQQAGMMVVRACRLCSKVPDRMLRVLFSISSDSLDSSRFRKDLQSKTVMRYTTIWQRFFVWLIRMHRAGRAEAESRFGVAMDNVEWDLLSDFRQKLDLVENELEDGRTRPLFRQVRFAMLRLVLYCATRKQVLAQRCRYLMQCFVATISMTEASFAHIEVSTQYCAIMVWGIRLCLILDVYGPDRLKTAMHIGNEAAILALHNELKAQHDTLLILGQQGILSVAGNFLDTLAFGKELTAQTSRPEFMQWESNGRAVSMNGKRIELLQISSMIKALIEQARASLHSVSGLALSDMDVYSQVTDDFSKHADLHWYGAHAEKANLKRALHRATLQGLLGSDGWNRSRCRLWLNRIARFKRDLFMLCHITGGPPARVSEMLKVKWKGLSTLPRGVYIHNDKVVLGCFGSGKTRALDRTGKTRITARYLPAIVGALLRGYLEHVAVLEEVIESELSKALAPVSTLTPHAGKSGSVPPGPDSDSDCDSDSDASTSHNRPEDGAVWRYLWRDGTTLWDHTTVLKLWKDRLEKYLGMSWSLREWRQMGVLIRRKYLPLADTAMGRRLNWGDNIMDDEDVSPAAGRAAGPIAMMNHAENTEICLYGREVGLYEQLGPDKLSVFEAVSTAWQEMPFWADSFAGGERERRKKRACPSSTSKPAKRQRRSSRPTPEEITSALQRATGGTTYKSAVQESAVKTMFDNPPALVVTMATGSGKSLLFMMSALAHQEAATVVVVPLRALLNDLIIRLRQLKIPFGELDSAQTGLPGWRNWKCILVSADKANDGPVRQALREASEKGKISRLFIDEAHMLVTDAGYRDCMLDLRNVIVTSVPLVLLSATIPPTMIEHLRERLLLTEPPLLVSGDVSRAGTEYEVCVLQPRKDCTFLDRVVEELLQDCESKGIVYGRTRREVEDLADKLGCSFYHSGSDVDSSAAALSERSKKLLDWNEAGGWIVASTALSTGVDIANVDRVVYAGRPWSMIEFAQGSGRGGRSGAHCLASVWLEKAADKERDRFPPSFRWDSGGDEAALNEFLSGEDCRRLAMNQYLQHDADLQAERCDDGSSRRCDVCLAELPSRSDQLATAIRLSATFRQGLKDYMDDLIAYINHRHECVVCFVLRQGQPFDHSWRDCTAYGGAKQWAEFQALWPKVRYRQEFVACYSCGLWQSCCPAQASKDCRYWVLVCGLVYATWRLESTESGSRWWVDLRRRIAEATTFAIDGHQRTSGTQLLFHEILHRAKPSLVQYGFGEQ